MNNAPKQYTNENGWCVNTIRIGQRWINWDRLAKRSGYNTIKITLEDGTPDGTMQWNYQRGDHTDCWIVTRHDNEDNQVGEGNYMAWNRSELPNILKEMGTQTILELDPDHLFWQRQR